MICAATARFRYWVPFLAFFGFACAVPAHAQWVSFPHGMVQLLTETNSITPGRGFSLGLDFRLESGWHIYWVNPGDSGDPPRVQWKLPAGITAEAMQWPVPHRLGSSSVADYGYTGDVLLIAPMRASANLPLQSPAKIGAQVKLLVCRELCVPVKAEVSVAVPVSSGIPAPSSSRALFSAARRSLPQPTPKNWRLTVKEQKDTFVLAAHTGFHVAHAQFFPLGDGQIENSAPQNLASLAEGFQLELRKSGRLVNSISRLKGVLVLPSGRAYQIDVPVRRAAPGTPGDGLGRSAN